ncbi:unnamed protein product [Microthlaspi erraticum]|uniref:Uncharacterized protein n=1 Tax=Microthlaspi erraticum TaxID=1685480 RepID=A0A6D2IJQ9_9BRAS|nr:unnamed protein product [Microthlaspi erraticum]
MDVLQLLKIILILIGAGKRSWLMGRASKNVEESGGWDLKLKVDKWTEERPEGVEGTIDMRGFKEKTNDNSTKMCLEGGYNNKYKPSEENVCEKTKVNRFKVCVLVGEKLIECILEEAKSDKEAYETIQGWLRYVTSFQSLSSH